MFFDVFFSSRFGTLKKNTRRNIKFGQEVNLIQKVPLGTPSQDSDIITS